MGLLKFKNISSLPDSEVAKEILVAENELFNLRFKKATRQNFSSSDIKKAKCRLAQLKTLLTLKKIKQK